ncbi:hypothetical protein MW374_003959 [Vibrio parahaemolyticus]|nr:hypothetical protein [Vibrio parahaemolyticus]EJB8530047.1 hypothetical protein [Vibrio parahaemolyticus]EJE4159011.1 hypothetical protein [Vibrio parahaemolyticus]HBC3820873.1 hypothetical protein [Vibrio parahaemolyticus]
MAFKTTEERVLEKLEEEKNYLWTAINELKSSVEISNQTLEKLEQDAPEHYKKTVGARNKVSEIKNKAEERLNEIEELFKGLESDYELASSLQEKSKSLVDTIEQQADYSKVTSDELAESYKAYVDTKTEIEEALLELNRLLEEKDKLSIKIESLSEQVDNSEILSGRLKALHSSAVKERNEISALHSEVFGFVDEDESGNEIEHVGLKAELDTAYSNIKDELHALHDEVDNVEKLHKKQLHAIEEAHSSRLDDFIEKSENQKKAILDKINSLLPDALTAGLSGAYFDKIKVEKVQLDKHENTFNRAILWLICCSSVPVIFTMVRVLFLDEAFAAVLKDAPLLYSMMLPVYAPILWVAYTSNKSYKLSKRLIEEYTHKEVSSRTFEGLSNQISNIGEDDINNELRTKLLFNLLQVNSENPGKLISDYNKSDHPIIDAIEKSSKLADAINRLDNVPLVSPLLKHLNAKERAKLEQKERDMKNVVDVAMTSDSKSVEQEQLDKTASNG